MSFYPKVLLIIHANLFDFKGNSDVISNITLTSSNIFTPRLEYKFVISVFIFQPFSQHHVFYTFNSIRHHLSRETHPFGFVHRFCPSTFSRRDSRQSPLDGLYASGPTLCGRWSSYPLLSIPDRQRWCGRSSRPGRSGW